MNSGVASSPREYEAITNANFHNLVGIIHNFALSQKFSRYCMMYFSCPSRSEGEVRANNNSG